MGNATSASANGLGKKSSAKDVVDHFAAAKSIPATELLKVCLTKLLPHCSLINLINDPNDD